VHFPPPRKFNPEGVWRFPCVAGEGCNERHFPTKCEVFKKLTPRQRLEKVEEKQLCKLCFRHLAVNDCWAKGKLPNCHIKGCGGGAQPPAPRRAGPGQGPRHTRDGRRFRPLILVL
jgi:hypothetical protein